MKQSIRQKINKLLLACSLKYNWTIFYNTEQVYSQKLEKVCTLRKLVHIPDITNTRQKKVIISSFREIDLLLELVDIWKKGEMHYAEASNTRKGKADKKEDGRADAGRN